MSPFWSALRPFVFVLLCAAAGAQQPFTLEQILSAPFPTELTAAPARDRLAWVFNQRGARNVWMAEAPTFQARRVTGYTADDGQDILDLRWTPDARAIVYVRGEAANRAGEYPNPTSNPHGAEQDVWIVSADGGEPRKIGEGSSPAVSASRVAFVRKGQIWSAPLDGSSAAAQFLQARGQAGDLRWSPDGSRLAFMSNRGDHALIGVYDPAASSVRYLDPTVDFDFSPVWSRDGRRIAFIRIPASGAVRHFGAYRTEEPWSIRVADVTTGRAREVWRAAEGTGSVFHGFGSDEQLFWGADGRLLFPWERDGWTHLYSVPEDGGAATLLTPGAFEVEQVALAPNGRELVYSSNQDDIDRRHIWRVGTASGQPRPVTRGTGIEWSPVFTSDGAAVAWLASDARRPGHPVVSGRDIAPEALPASLPLKQLVEPQQVILSAADGMQIHGQLFLPAGGGRHPAVIFFHGGSRRQMLLGWHYMFYYHNAYALNQYLASRGYVVLSVNYRSGIGYGLDFREALNYGPAGGSEYNDVQGAGIYLRGRPDVEPNRIGLWGGSYGGYLTAMGLARASDLFAAGVDLHGVHDWSTELNMPRGEPATREAFESSPMAYVDTWRSPVLLIHGDDDRNVQFGQTIELVNALRRRKVYFEQIVFADEIHDFLTYAHWLDAYRAAADFFERKLREGKP